MCIVCDILPLATAAPAATMTAIFLCGKLKERIAQEKKETKPDDVR